MNVENRAIALGLLLAAGCSAAPIVPPTPPPGLPRLRHIVQKSFRLGTFDFGQRAPCESAKCEPSSVETALPAMLLTELKDIGRFSVYEGGNLRTDGPLNEGSAREFVDGYLSGTITSASASKACFEARLANAVNHEVLYAVATCVDLDANGTPQRAAVKRVAEELSRAVKQVGYGRVKSADGQLIVTDKGSDAGVMRGMVAYVVSTGDSVTDPAMHQKVQALSGVDPASMASRGQIVVGELYVVSVETDSSVGVLFRGDYGLPGDTVFFK